MYKLYTYVTSNLTQRASVTQNLYTVTSNATPNQIKQIGSTAQFF